MKKIIFCILFLISSQVLATLEIPMFSTTSGKKIGIVKADDTIYGLLLTPRLSYLKPGIHGFHIHVMDLCDDHGMAAGGHLDPRKTDQHQGPYSGDGHLGDLPVLIVNARGNATLPVLAPRLKLSQIKGHSLMIHEGGDNYSDYPKKLGGGGLRAACGEIPYY